MEQAQSILRTATEIALERLVAALTADDVAILEWLVMTTRGHQRPRDKPEHYDTTDGLIAMLS